MTLRHSKRSKQSESEGDGGGSPNAGRSIAATRSAARACACARALRKQVWALRRDKHIAVRARDPQHDAVRPAKAGLNGVLSAPTGRIDVGDRELLKHLQWKEKSSSAPQRTQ